MNGKKNYYIHSLIGILIMIIFAFIPPFGPVTEVGVQVLGVFLGTMYLWTFVDTLWPSLFGVLMMGLTGFGNFNSLLSSTFGSPIVVMLFFVILMTGAITEEGVCEYISRWFITRKVSNGRPWVFTALFLTGVYIISVLTAPTPTIFIFWPILYSLFATLGYKKGDKYATLMLIAVVMAASFGFATTPFKGALTGLLGNYAKVTGAPIEYLSFMAVSVPVSLAGLAVIILSMRFIFRPDIALLKDVNVEMFNKKPLPPMNLRQKAMTAALIVFIIWVLCPPLLPDSPIKQILTASQNAIPVLIIAVCCFLKVEGKPLVNFNAIAAKYMIWPVVLLKSVLTPVFEGKSPLIFTVACVTIACILTNVCNNMVVGMLLIPIIHVFSMEIGASAAVITSLSMYMVCIAVVTPAASTTSAILHGNSTWMNTGEIYKYGIIMTVLSLITVLAVGLPIASLVFG